jgi:hypothetical protein
MQTPPPSDREVHCADALPWLAARGVLEGCSLITSLPDLSELPGLSVPEWKAWFVGAAAAVLRACPPDGVTIFFQTDVKPGGTWLDKGYLVSKAAEAVGVETLWHKVVCRRPAGTVTFGRPAYSHLLCFSRGLRDELSRASADVLPEAGPTPWTRGMGAKACELACRYVLERTPTRTVVDPFCGRGTLLAVANAMGLSAIGVELSAKRARQARSLRADALGAAAPRRHA